MRVAAVHIPRYTRAINSTVVHECYHTLVFRRKINPADCKLKIVELLKDPRTAFLNMTKSVSLFALDLASKTNLGGRDSSMSIPSTVLRLDFESCTKWTNILATFTTTFHKSTLATRN